MARILFLISFFLLNLKMVHINMIESNALNTVYSNLCGTVLISYRINSLTILILSKCKFLKHFAICISKNGILNARHTLKLHVKLGFVNFENYAFLIQSSRNTIRYCGSLGLLVETDHLENTPH